MEEIFQNLILYFLVFSGRNIPNLVSNITVLGISKLMANWKLRSDNTQTPPTPHFDTVPQFFPPWISLSSSLPNFVNRLVKHDEKAISVAFIGSSF